MNVISANRFLFGMLLLVLTALIITSPFGGAGQCAATFFTIVFLGVMFPDTVGSFLQDSRFKTPPRLKTAIALTALDLTVTFGLIFFWITVIALYFPAYLEQLEAMALDTQPGTREQLLMFIAGAIFVPFYEEFVFRGVVLRAYERARSPIYAAFLTSVLFALVHGTLIQLLAFIPGSFLMARGVQNRGSWWLAVIPHVINNGLIFGVFPFLPSETEEEPQLIIGIVSLVIAGIAFTIAARWLKIFTNKVSEAAFQRDEKIWTPTLICVVLFGISVIILTTFVPLDPESISGVTRFFTASL
ncbi:MAG: CPBP family intramembrane metalloprotease [Cyanobacteria bacterium SBLK]|nr:CPBP family intramembrane metalloprotease [Cyanobacteria bacterium SBLK]